MSNASVVTAKKPCYRFYFNDEVQAGLFHSFAFQQEGARLVQFPYDPNRRVSQDRKKVFVTGSGSYSADMPLLERLVQRAEQLGGHYLPRT